MFKKFAQAAMIVMVMAMLFTLPVQAATSHTISGTILLNGLGLKGVVVTVQGTTLTSTTDGLGNYAIHYVPYGSSGTVVPVLANYSFTPTSFSFTNLTADLTGKNFTATQVATLKYSISGKITYNSNALAGVTVTFGTLTTTTNTSGVYSFSNVPAGTKGRIVPKLSGYGFTPVYITVSSLSGNLTNQNFTAWIAYTISGTITETGTGLPVSGATVTFGIYKAISGTTGVYNIRNIPAGTSGTLTPSLTGKTFTPTSITIPSLTSSLHSENFVAAP